MMMMIMFVSGREGVVRFPNPLALLKWVGLRLLFKSGGTLSKKEELSICKGRPYVTQVLFKWNSAK